MAAPLLQYFKMNYVVYLKHKKLGLKHLLQSVLFERYVLRYFVPRHLKTGKTGSLQDSRATFINLNITKCGFSRGQEKTSNIKITERIFKSGFLVV